MKKITLFFIIILFINGLFGVKTPSSLPFANSYLQRSSGAESLYWNPALISNVNTSGEWMSMPYVIEIENNMISVDLYNRFFRGRHFNYEEITAIKNEILDAIGDRFNMKVNLKIILVGMSFGNYAYSTSTNVLFKSSLHSDFIELAFVSNDEFRIYDFGDDHNDFILLGYQDFTFGYGGYNVNQLFPENMDFMPNITVGAGLSYLRGIYTDRLSEFDGVFRTSNEDGVVLYQSVKRISGERGNGIKASLGISVDAFQFDENHYITTGMSLDNIGASIRWTYALNEHENTVRIDSLHVNKLDKDIYTESNGKTELKAFTTKLPLNLKIGALYKFNELSASIDYAQNFGSGVAISFSPEISFGIEYILGDYFPIQIGHRLPIDDIEMANSIGLGLRLNRYEFGAAYQSIGSFHSYSNTGFAIGSYMKFRF